MQTIKKSIGQGFGKGELYESLAYNPNDRYGGKAIKQLGFNPESGKTAITIGDSTTAITLAAAAQRAISIVTTCALTTGAIKSVEIAQTHTGANTASNIEVLKVQLTSDVKTGTWVNAIFGRVNYTANGYAYGAGSAICGELSLPASGRQQGTYSVFQAEIDVPSGATAIGSETSVFDINVWGDAKGVFDDNGWLFTTDGLTAAADHILSLTSQTLKCKAEDLTRYLVLSQMQDGLGLGVSGTRMALTASTKAIYLYTTTAATSGALGSVVIDQTHTGASTGNNIEVFEVQFTSDVKTGAWVNAIFGRTNYTANGWAYGSGSAICGELSLPSGGTHGGQGTYSVFQAELDVPASCPGIGTECSIFDINVWGDQKAKFDDNGFLFSISGVTSNSGKFFYDNTAGVVDAFLKCRINETTYYLLLADDQS